jgi:outer membrane protein OmpA-like peptidoglycan-associated protein
MYQFRIVVSGLLLLGMSGVSLGQGDGEDFKRITPQQEPLANAAVASSDLQVGVWVDRPDGLYLPGERLVVYVRVSQAAYVHVLNVDATGLTTRLVPNPWETGTLIPAAGVKAYPAGASSGYSFAVSQPYGSNLIKVIASSKPFTFGAASSKGFLTDQASSFARHIEAVPNQPTIKWATAQLAIGVVPQRAAGAGGVPVVAGVPPAGPGVQTNPPVPPPATAGALPANLDSLPSAFGLQLMTDKSSYRIGEPIRLQLASERNCSLAVAALYPDGHLTVLYPNATDKDVRLSKGETKFLPVTGSKSGSLSIDGPAGNHAFVAVCAEQKNLLDGLLGRSASDEKAAFTSSATLDGFLSNTGSNAKLVARKAAIYTVVPWAESIMRAELVLVLMGALGAVAAGVQPPALDTRAVIGALSPVPVTGSPSPAAMLEIPLQFELNSTRLTPDNVVVLDVLAQALNDPALIGGTFQIEGHTDATGTAEENHKLSKARAQAVKAYLELRGVAGARLTAVGYGNARPLPGLNSTDPQHRRVIIVREF